MNTIKITRRAALNSLSVIVALMGNISLQANAVSCGDTIVTNTTLTSADILTSCPGPGLIVAASNITLNCDGHMISGSGTDIGVTLDSVSGVEVKNCSVDHFAYGIAILAGADENSLTKNRVSGSTLTGGGGYHVQSNKNILQNNFATSGAGRGFVLMNGSKNVLFRNTASTNGFRGYDIIDSSSNVLVGNKAIDNFSGGFVFQDLSASSSDNSVYFNTAENNSSEGFANFAGGNYFLFNKARINGTLGFNDTVSSGTPNTYTSNKCVGNSAGGSSNPGVLCTPQL